MVAQTATPHLNSRFTIDGSDALEQSLQRTCDQISVAVRRIIPGRRLEAILLGGGYGRGEGGVLKTPAGDRPYNDLEFYICVRGNRWHNQQRYDARLHHAAEELSAGAGIEVEFKLTSLDEIRSSPLTMFHYDLAVGHKVCWGSPTALASSDHLLRAEAIPLHEATRLLMNRCSGLLFAAERLRRHPFTPEHADFVGRNLAKARLGFGDAVLAAHGQYHWSCRERHQRLLQLKMDLPCWFEVLAHHAAGVRFKLLPQQRLDSPEESWTEHAELSNIGLQVWLWLEDQRLQEAFSTARQYALSPISKCPETSPWRNLLVNLRYSGPGVLLTGNFWRHPREQLLNALPLLLWEESVFREDGLLEFLQGQLNTKARTFATLVRAYEELWKRFN